MQYMNLVLKKIFRYTQYIAVTMITWVIRVHICQGDCVQLWEASVQSYHVKCKLRGDLKMSDKGYKKSAKLLTLSQSIGVRRILAKVAFHLRKHIKLDFSTL